MEEYEVDLIDYLRVMWRWKWGVIAVLVIAVGVSFALSFTKPDRYSGVINYKVEETGTALGITGIRAATLADILDTIDPNSLGPGLSLKKKVKEDEVSVTLTGALPPDELRKALDRLTALMDEKLRENVQTRMSLALKLAAQKETQLSREKALLSQEMASAASPDLSAAFAEQVASLALQLAQVKVQEESLRNTDPTDLFTLQEMNNPTISRVGPHRALNLGVAAVLGGFVGVLLAFFFDYIASYRKRERG